VFEALEAILVAAAPATTAILLAAMGGAINMQAGIVNIGLDGLMLAGAFVAVLVCAGTGSPALGVAAAGVAGGVVGWLFSLTLTRLDANQIIAGLGLNLAIAGLIGYLLPVKFGVQGTYLPAGLRGLPSIRIPGVDALPVVGPIVSGHDALTYLSWLSVPAVAFFLRRTTWGIDLRATGADEEAARAAGIPTRRWRDVSTVVAGVFAGLAGAQLSLGVVTLFNKNMTGGRGFIALAAFYFGGARAWPTAVASVLFGVFEAAAAQFGSSGLPPQLVQMLPYLVVVAALAVVGWRRAWAARRRARLALAPSAAEEIAR
jgi:general nucleoside transport system permease protein